MQDDFLELSPYPHSAISDVSDCIQPNWAPLEWPANLYTASPISESPRTFSGSPFLCDTGTFFDESFDEPSSCSSLSNENHVEGNPGMNVQHGRFIHTNRAPALPETAGSLAPLNLSTIYDRQLFASDEDNDNSTGNRNSSATKPIRQYRPARTRSTQQTRSHVESRSPRKGSQASEKDKLGLRGVAETEASIRLTQSTGKPPLTKRTSSGSDCDPGQGPKVRHNHNLTEKRYRSRLNDQFETLLSALPASSVAAIEGGSHGGSEPLGRKISKAEVLILAKEHIQALETSREALQEQNRKLTTDMEQLEVVWDHLVGRPVS